MFTPAPVSDKKVEKEAFVAKSRLKSSKPDVVKTSSISKPLILSKSSSKSGKHAKPPEWLSRVLPKC